MSAWFQSQVDPKAARYFVAGQGLETLNVDWKKAVGRFKIGPRIYWCERGDSNPHGFPRQILSLHPATDFKQDHQGTSADSGKVLQNPQPRRNKSEHKGKE
jgi:hypothetical protein